MLDDEFTELPAQGVNAGLEGIMLRKDDWGRDEKEWWGRRVEGRIFVVQIGVSWEAGVNVGVEGGGGYVQHQFGGRHCVAGRNGTEGFNV